MVIIMVRQGLNNLRGLKVKYNNKKTIVDGIKFDSKKEASRYQELRLLQRSSAITSLMLQPSFVLQEKFKKNGKAIRSIKYIADFSYYENGKRIIEDVKGVQTEVFKIKKKLFELKYPELTIKIT